MCKLDSWVTSDTMLRCLGYLIWIVESVSFAKTVSNMPVTSFLSQNYDTGILGVLIWCLTFWWTPQIWIQVKLLKQVRTDDVMSMLFYFDSHPYLEIKVIKNKIWYLIFSKGWYMDLISLPPTIFQLSPFYLGCFYLPSNSSAGGGYCAKSTICKPKVNVTCSWGSEGHYKPPSPSGSTTGPWWLLGVLGMKAQETLVIFYFKLTKTVLKLVWCLCLSVQMMRVIKFQLNKTYTKKLVKTCSRS